LLVSLAKKLKLPQKQEMAAKPTPDEFLSSFPPAVQSLANDLRALVKETVPTVTEAVYPGWKLIGYRVKKGRRSAYFCFIAPFENRVMLGFEYGILLFDPELRLEGEGTQVRYLTVREQEDIQPVIFGVFIAEAAQLALQHKTSKKP
jgi:hypothetical protein